LGWNFQNRPQQPIPQWEEKFRRFIVRRRFPIDAFAVIGRDSCDGDFFGIRQSSDSLKIRFFTGIWNHDDLLRAGGRVVLFALKIREGDAATKFRCF